jgi:hypothetical protein
VLILSVSVAKKLIIYPENIVLDIVMGWFSMNKHSNLKSYIRPISIIKYSLKGIIDSNIPSNWVYCNDVLNSIFK